MLKDAYGYDNVLVIIDRLGKRAFLLPSYKRATAADAAELYYKFVFRVFGLPKTITSDRGP